MTKVTAETMARDAVLDVLESGEVTAEGLVHKFFPPNPGFGEKHLHQAIGAMLAKGDVKVNAKGKLELTEGGEEV